jgi:hypothetical protein
MIYSTTFSLKNKSVVLQTEEAQTTGWSATFEVFRRKKEL